MSFFNKLKNSLNKTKENIDSGFNKVFANFRSVDEDLIDELEEVLILSDVGMDAVLEITDRLRKNIKIKNIKEVEAVKKEIKEIIIRILEENTIQEEDVSVFKIILVIGVNGVGKTTSIGKIANLYKQQGQKVLVAAGDTYRAAAVEQLEEWVKKSGSDIIKGNPNEDPASVIYNTIQKAVQDNYDVVICDTAGRIHNKTNLMEELAKINRSIDKAIINSNKKFSKETLLVIDGTVGQNAINQTKAFMEVTDITSLVVTKLDGTAKGGAVIGITQETKIPIKYIGVGEKLDDLERFNAKDFVNAIID